MENNRFQQFREKDQSSTQPNKEPEPIKLDTEHKSHRVTDHLTDFKIEKKITESEKPRKDDSTKERVK